MTDRELMQQALEALDLLAWCENPATRVQVRKPKGGNNIVTVYPHKVATDAAELLRERLAQPEQEPVLETVYETIIHWDEGGGKRSRRELARRIVDLYTAPAQRKPLTEEEIERACVPLGAAMLSFTEVARAIEAAHGIKENA